MVFRKYFPTMFTASSSFPAQSKNAMLYLLRCIFYMGIRTPPKRYFFVYCLWSFVLNLCSTFYLPFAFMTPFFRQLSEVSPGEFLTSLQVTFNVWTCSLKVIIVWVLVNRFDKATELLDEMDKRIVQSSERSKIHRAVSLSNTIFFFFMTVYVCYAMFTFSSALAIGRPPYQFYYPGLDWRAGKWQFWLQFSLEFFSMLGACFTDACVDCYPLNIILPLRAHMAIFADRLRQLGRNSNDSAEQCLDELIKCIQHHKLILRYCDTLRPMIAGTIFVELLVVGVVLGIILINIAFFANLGSSLGSLALLLVALIETTPFCILCNYLVDDCFNLADELFESNWISQDQRYKKTVLQFLQNLQQPIIFMAGNMFPISVATNLTALKFSFSVFTLVKQMNIAEKFAMSHEID